MKKLLTSILVVVLLLTGAVAIFAACDTTDYDNTIVFYTQQNDNLQKITATAIAKFEAKYPGWKVDHQYISNGYTGVKTKVINTLSSKKQPDLAYCYADHVAMYMRSKKVIDISTIINSKDSIKGKEVTWNADAGKWEEGADASYAVGYTDAEMANFVPAFLAEGYGKNFTGANNYGYGDESLLMMPFVKSTEAMFYNETALRWIITELKYQNRTSDLALFSKDGGETVFVPRTWHDLFAQAEVVNEFFPKVTLLGYDSEANWFITESERQGWGYTSVEANNHYLFANPAASTWLDYLGGLEGLNQDNLITTQQMSGGAYTSNLFKQGVGTLEDGSIVDNGTGGGVLYCVGSTGGATNQETEAFTWGVSNVPGSYVGTWTKSNGNFTFNYKSTSGYTLKNYETLVDGKIVSDIAISQGPSLVMLRSDKAKDPDLKAKMTFLFMKELYDPQIQSAISQEQGYSPCILNTATAIPSYQDFLDDTTNIKALAVALSNRLATNNMTFVSPAFVGSSDARDQVGNAMQFVLEAISTGTDALNTAKSNCP